MAQSNQGNNKPRKQQQKATQLEFAGFLDIYIDAETKRIIKSAPLTPEQQIGSLFKMINSHLSIQLRLEDDDLSYRALIQDRDLSSRTAGKMLSLFSKDFSRLLDLIIYTHFETLGGDYSSLVSKGETDSDF